MIIPWDYQVAAKDALWDYFRTKSGNPLVALPTGTGKSVVIADFLHSIYAVYPAQRTMILTHVKELIQQNYEKLLSFWPMAPAGINSAGLGRRDTAHRIIFAGIASVAKRAAEFGRIDLVIVDECHLISPNEETMYNVFFAALRLVNPQLKVIGFTATAWRLGVGKIEGAGLFTDTAFDMTHMTGFNWLIDQGYLLPLIPKPTKTLLDVDGVHLRGGEFIAGELQAAVDRNEVTEACLREMLEYAQYRHSWLLFCSGVEHSIHTAQILTMLGVQCEAVHSKMPDKGTNGRDAILEAYKKGWLRAVANNNVLTTGFDHPALDFIGMLRPTASPVLWVQMLGRGTRPLWPDDKPDLSTQEKRLALISQSQKQNCLVLDFAGNTKRLGPINDPMIPHKKGSKGGDAPVKLCEVCNTWNHASARICFNCKTPFPLAVKIQYEASTEALIKKSDMPIVEVFKIDHVTYEAYQRAGKPAMMKVCYYSGLRKFNEFVCFDHDGYALRKAREWWRQRTQQPIPTNTSEAMHSTDVLKVATHLRVWLNKQYPEIMAHCYDGTAFGATAPSGVEPAVQVLNVVPKQTNFGKGDLDDDIPFAPVTRNAGAPAPAHTTNSFVMDDDIPF